MKHLFFYIVSLFLLFNIPATSAETYDLPEDYEGHTLNEMLQKNTDNASENQRLGTIINFFAEVSNYLYKHYTIEQMAEDDFTEKLRPFFPDDNDDELREKQIWLVNGVSIYNKGSEYYKEFIEKFMVPQTRRKVKNESEFDHPDEVPYIEAEKGHFIKVYNFKKFLTYGNDETEIQAVIDFQEAQKNPKSLHNQIRKASELLEWKKLPFYGTVYKNPLLSDLGLSEWQKNNDVSSKLISRSTYISGSKELDFGIQIKTEPFTFIPANNISPEILKPLVDFSGSENIEKAELIYPVPLNTIKHQEIHKYFGDFMLPIKITVKDTKKPLIVRAKLKLSSCDNNFNCTPLEFNLEQSLDANGPEIFDNGYDNYFYINNSLLPTDTLSELKLKRFIAESDENGPFLRLEFSTKPTVKSFKIFIEEIDGYTLFSAPFISFRDNKIYVRLEPKDKNADLQNKSFQITATLNNRYSLRKVYSTGELSVFDTDTPHLNLALVMLALLGGFILNFMPCVFPVLSIKAMSLSRLKTKHLKQLRQNIYSTLLGIFSGFTLLVIMLLICKYLGYSLGWGMQFQSITFLTVMTFVVWAFALTMPSISADSLSRFFSPNLSKKAGFAIGNLIVLLSTPCTAPYLATAIGFALSGSYIDIIVIMYSVALGLAVPYIIILCLKHPENLFPKPGKWMNILAKIMHYMLYLTVLWLLSLIAGQTDWIFILKFLFILLIFGFILYIYRQFAEYLNGVFDESVTVRQITRLKKQSLAVVSLICILLIFGTSVMARKSYSQNLLNNLTSRQTFIDTDRIEDNLQKNRPVLLEIGADWCMTCHVNNLLLFHRFNKELLRDQYNLEFIKVDWTNYNKEILDFMEKYGRKGLPFYILYTPLMREGMVLPEMFDLNELTDILNSSWKH